MVTLLKNPLCKQPELHKGLTIPSKPHVGGETQVAWEYRSFLQKKLNG